VRKLLNDPFAVVDEMVDGLEAAYASQIDVTPSRRGVVMREPWRAPPAAVVDGGGSRHEPALMG
jgi:dihydroxyacetone kinase-like protein